MSDDRADMDDAETLRRLVEVLGDLGYRAKVEDDVVISSVGGVRMSVQLYGSNSIQLATGMRGIPETFGLEQVNEFNRKYRFGSVYQDEPGTVVLQANFLLDATEAIPEDLVETILGLVEGLVSELRSAIEATDVEGDVPEQSAE